MLTLRSDFGPNLGFLNWISANFQAWEHEKLPNLGIFGERFENLVILVTEKGVLWN